ncbi:hypothetical protein MIMGU_mgv1a025573mg, partial [Erythranthe guttata]
KWVLFAMHKQVKRFDLDLSVPDKFFALWLNLSFACCLRSGNVFLSLRSVRLVSVDIKDEMVRYFLDSCPYIEKISIRGSVDTKDVEFVDPLPYMKVLEISECCNIQSLVISVKNLVSCTYEGNELGSFPVKNVPNLSELTLGGSVARQIFPHDLPQLHALKRLELSIVSQVGRSLLLLTSLIKASPQLHEFKIKSLVPFPEVTSVEADVFYHKNLNAVEIDGYCGCASEDEFIGPLCKIAATSLKTVIIDTDCDYYRDHPDYKYIIVMYRPRQDGKLPMMKGVKKRKRAHEEPIEDGHMNRFDAKKHAERFASCFPPFGIKFIVR